jgi:hypothetical protein
MRRHVTAARTHSCAVFCYGVDRSLQHLRVCFSVFGACGVLLARAGACSRGALASRSVLSTHVSSTVFRSQRTHEPECTRSSARGSDRLCSSDIAVCFLFACIHGQNIRIKVQGVQQVLLQRHRREVRQVVPRQTLPRGTHAGRAALAARVQCTAAGCCASRRTRFGARGWCFVARVHSVPLAQGEDARPVHSCQALVCKHVVPPQYVRRLQGVDLARRDLRDEHPRACTVVGCALFRNFVPAANAIFAANPSVRYILFAEDDCRLARAVSLEHLIESCRTACSLRKPAWLAFKQRRGKPNFGAHLLAFSRCSLNVFVKDAAAKDPCGTLALDTLLRALWLEGRVWTPCKSLAVQALHALKGRR